MTNPNPAENEQTALWNGRAGRAWVDAQPLLDRLLQPFEDELVGALDLDRKQRLLDIGCGTGSTTLAAARLLGAQGDCVGVDISAPMIATARERAAQQSSTARFVCADAQTHAFEPDNFDTLISRFGVMFFDDPVQAFGNLRRAARTGATLRFICWRDAAENPFMTTAERAAAPLLPDLPARRPDAPGQFAFADRERVASILQVSGWTDIEIRPLDVECVLPESELIGYFTRLGPVGAMLQEADDATRARIIGAVRPAFDPFVQGEEVRFVAACWVVVARAAAAQEAGHV
jgi:SAM-dependent methyltransferase